MEVLVYTEHMSVFIAKRKTDTFREGHTSLIARSNKATCPIRITAVVTSPLVRRIVKVQHLICFFLFPLFFCLFIQWISFHYSLYPKT